MASQVSSLLELVDVWTQTTEVDEYVEFLDGLLETITQQQKEQTSAPAAGGGDGGGGDGDGAVAALGQRFGWRTVEEIESLSPLLKQWAQPEDEEEAVELVPTKPDDQAGLSPTRGTSARPSSRSPVAPATGLGSQADAVNALPLHKARASTKAGATKTVGSNHTTSRTAPQKQAPARKGASRASRVGDMGSVGSVGGAGGAPAGQLKSLSSAPIEEVVEKLADLTTYKMLLSPPRSPLKGAVNAQRALMAMQAQMQVQMQGGGGGDQHAVDTEVPPMPATGRERVELPQPQNEVWPHKKVAGAYVVMTMPPPAAGALASLGVYDEYESARASTPIAPPVIPPTPGVMAGNVHNSCHRWSDVSNSRLAHGGGYAGGGTPLQG